MARKSKKDKATELFDRYNKLKQDHVAFKRQMEYLRQQYFMQHWVSDGKAKEGEERVTLPTCTNTVDMAHAVLLAQRRNIHAVPVRQTTKAQARSSELEKFLQGVFYVNELRAGEDRVALALWNALVKKMGWIRYRWDMELQKMVEPPTPIPPAVEGMPATAPEQPVPMLVFEECPIVIDNIPPENMFVKWGGRKGVLYLFYAARRKLEEVEAEYGRLRMEPFRKMRWEERAQLDVDFLEYWGWDGKRLMTATMVDDNFIPRHELREAEGYTNIPYVPLYCFRTAEDLPHRRVRGLMESMTDMVHIQERMLTKLNRQLKMFAMMPLLAQQGTAGEPIDVDASLGAVIHLKRDQTISFPTWPGTPPDFRWLLGVAEDKVQESGFPAVSFGQGPGSLSGYAITQYNEGARARLNLPRLNFALALTSICQGIVSLCMNFAPNMGIPVFGRYKNADFYTTLTGDDMKGHIIKVNIVSELPGDEVRKAVIGGQLKQAGALSERTIMERWMGIENVEDEMQQKLREMASKHPAVMLSAVARALAEDADPIARVALQQLEQALTQIQAPPPVTRPAPQGAAPQGPPPPRPMGVPSSVIPAIAQGQTLRQEVGMPPTRRPE